MLLCSPAYPSPYCWNLVALGLGHATVLLLHVPPTMQGRCCELCLISEVLACTQCFCPDFVPKTVRQNLVWVQG